MAMMRFSAISETLLSGCCPALKPLRQVDGDDRLNSCMKIREIILESGALDSALKRGQVLIQYVKLDGTSRILTGTTNPGLFTYAYKRTRRPLKTRRNIVVWDLSVGGWRSLRRNRISGWEEKSLD
jgi:hypothetical protein